MTKKITLASLAVIAVLAISSMAFAGPGQGHMGRNGQPGMWNNLTPEKQAEVKKIFDAHREKMDGLRDQLWAKHTTLDALVDSGKATKSDIESLVSDMVKIKRNMDRERDALSTELEKTTGLRFFGGPGFGCGGPGFGQGYHHRGFKGHGRGMGPGYGMMGYGQMGPGFNAPCYN